MSPGGGHLIFPGSWAAPGGPLPAPKVARPQCPPARRRGWRPWGDALASWEFLQDVAVALRMSLQTSRDKEVPFHGLQLRLGHAPLLVPGLASAGGSRPWPRRRRGRQARARRCGAPQVTGSGGPRGPRRAFLGLAAVQEAQPPPASGRGQEPLFGPLPAFPAPFLCPSPTGISHSSPGTWTNTPHVPRPVGVRDFGRFTAAALQGPHLSSCTALLPGCEEQACSGLGTPAQPANRWCSARGGGWRRLGTRIPVDGLPCGQRDQRAGLNRQSLLSSQSAPTPQRCRRVERAEDPALRVQLSASSVCSSVKWGSMYIGHTSPGCRGAQEVSRDSSFCGH